ncbi:hypothetical protein X743_17270 [Mesorhizobium sp. LNHC252B00]|nr:hypothetical protein X743_17270 [Mesorhizobium sp. LNHC252B00]
MRPRWQDIIVITTTLFATMGCIAAITFITTT